MFKLFGTIRAKEPFQVVPVRTNSEALLLPAGLYHIVSVRIGAYTPNLIVHPAAPRINLLNKVISFGDGSISEGYQVYLTHPNSRNHSLAVDPNNFEDAGGFHNSRILPTGTMLTIDIQKLRASNLEQIYWKLHVEGTPQQDDQYVRYFVYANFDDQLSDHFTSELHMEGGLSTRLSATLVKLTSRGISAKTFSDDTNKYLEHQTHMNPLIVNEMVRQGIATATYDTKLFMKYNETIYQKEMHGKLADVPGYGKVDSSELVGLSVPPVENLAYADALSPPYKQFTPQTAIAREKDFF